MSNQPKAQSNPQSAIMQYWGAYRQRLRRKKLLFQALRKRRQLSLNFDRTHLISKTDILLFSTMRNELLRLPYFLEHYRSLGVGHFLIVDNGSDDGTAEYLQNQGDVSLWQTDHSYKSARFGADWLTWLQIKFGNGHWCLTVDADEILIYPEWDSNPLSALTEWLDKQSIPAFGTMMLDMYPKGPTDQTQYMSGSNPMDILNWFDATGYVAQRQWPLGNLWMQGGVRQRVFFTECKTRAPTLNKLPLVKWNRRYSYVNSTHSMLPPHLNRLYNGVGDDRLSGILLHTKFLHTISQVSKEEQKRGEHFRNGILFDSYYDILAQSPDMWCEQSVRYQDWRQLVDLGLMSSGNWIGNGSKAD